MYKINQIAKIAGITTRTLRHYDSIGLLCPKKDKESKYRLYSEEDILLLQQILFYRKLDFKLDDIKSIVNDPHFNFNDALINHKTKLIEEKTRINVLLNTIDKTIRHNKGELKMKNDEKFEGLKDTLIEENDKKYGQEIREKYGQVSIDNSYKKMKKMSKWEFNEAKRLEIEIKTMLGKALTEDTQEYETEIAQLHQKWIQMYWSEYSTEAHLGLVKMYLDDERFKAYYEKIGNGATQYLFNAVTQYLTK